jgi:ABC-type antimicrobial peptide transport system permease subunit
VLGIFVSIVFSGGAILGAMITMYAQVAARAREIAMIRAIGFSKRSVLLSMIVESASLGAAGGIFGAMAAALMRVVQIRTMNFQTFAEVRFGFQPTPGILLAALGFGVLMGLCGGILPAARAARMPIVEATRA